MISVFFIVLNLMQLFNGAKDLANQSKLKIPEKIICGEKMLHQKTQNTKKRDQNRVVSSLSLLVCLCVRWNQQSVTRAMIPLLGAMQQLRTHY